jgi:hypothetical protein
MRGESGRSRRLTGSVAFFPVAAMQTVGFQPALAIPLLRPIIDIR